MLDVRLPFIRSLMLGEERLAAFRSNTSNYKRYMRAYGLTAF